MMSLRPPSTSRSPSPGANENGKQANNNSRQSMGPSARGTPLAPSSPRPGGGRPTSELLNSPGIFQTPESEAIDQWFENLQNYEATLEDMAAASMDVNFKEELSAIEQWFKVLSEAERTAALYSLLQHSTQVQIRFFITVLQQMARSDPMTALLSPAAGGSMQAQMEAKLATLKSPGLNSKLPASPTARNFSSPAASRQSMGLDSPASNFLSPDSAAIGQQGEAAATLAQQRAKLKASNASHRISAPVLSTGGADNRNTWGAQLSQVVEQNGPIQEVTIGGSRPKSTEFSGSILSPRPDTTGMLSPAMGDSWASMVNTPLIPMFANPKQQQQQQQPGGDAAQGKIGDWGNVGGSSPGVPRMGDPTVHRRVSKGEKDNKPVNTNNNGGDQSRNNAGGFRNASGGFNGTNGWAGARSPALSNVSSNNRFAGSDDGGHLNGLGMHMAGVGGFNMGLASPGLGMPGGMVPGMGGMPPISPFNMNMNMLSAMGISPEAQLLAAQMAASGMVQPNAWLTMQAQAGLLNQNQNQRRGPASNRGGMKTSSNNGRGDANKGGEEDVDPQILTDVSAWLRSLRLHKYTPNFEGMKWQDMVIMDEAALEAKGVAALGARRKMLKTFDVVRKKMGIEGSASANADSAAAAASTKNAT